MVAEWQMQVNSRLSFPNGKLDLSQAEAVADLISSDNERVTKLPCSNAGFSNEIAKLRKSY
jgi:tRNA modification GTPase